MDWGSATMWWVAAGVLVALEMGTGTFYLLMLALGCAAGAVAAHVGLGGSGQIVAAALVGGLSTAGWHFKRARQPHSAPAASNRDVNLDIGQSVQVERWSDDGTASVRYRGAQWQVRFAGNGTPQPGSHVIVAVQGSELAVAPAAAR